VIEFALKPLIFPESGNKNVGHIIKNEFSLPYIVSKYALLRLIRHDFVSIENELNAGLN
jgi:hypothetical protein